jgi:hypothetical protein
VPSGLGSQIVPISPVETPAPQKCPLTEEEIQETLNGTERPILDQMAKLTETIRDGSSEKPSSPVTSSSMGGSGKVKIREYDIDCIQHKNEYRNESLLFVGFVALFRSGHFGWTLNFQCRISRTMLLGNLLKSQRNYRWSQIAPGKRTGEKSLSIFITIGERGTVGKVNPQLFRMLPDVLPVFANGAGPFSPGYEQKCESGSKSQ